MNRALRTVEVARLLLIDVSGTRSDRVSRCPSCLAETTSTGLGVLRAGAYTWSCFACGERGDNLDLVARELEGRTFAACSPRQAREVERWLLHQAGRGSS